MATKTFNTDAEFTNIDDTAVFGDAVYPAAEIAASTDYHWVLKLSSYVDGNSNYAKINGYATGATTGAGAIGATGAATGSVPGIVFFCISCHILTSFYSVFK